MAEHSRLSKTFANRIEATRFVDSGKECPEFLKEFAFDFKNFNDKRFFMEIFLHGSDIGNPCVPMDMYMNWAYLVTEEFNYQVDLVLIPDNQRK